jgi:ubiquinone/menaquinone biosynthesis C-methylase UbiE
MEDKLDIIEKQEKNKYARRWIKEYRASQPAFLLADFIHRQALPEDSLLEVGCGSGRTINDLLLKGRRCTGLDITLAGIRGDKTGFVEAPIWRMPFKDEQFDFTFSTDTLEHLPPEMVEAAIKEIFRVTRRKTFHCIATFPHVVDDEPLHLTVQPIAWWVNMFIRYGTTDVGIEIVDRVDFLRSYGR